MFFWCERGLFVISWWYKYACKRIQERYFSSALWRGMLKRPHEAALPANVFHFKQDRFFHAGEASCTSPGADRNVSPHYWTEYRGKNIIKMLLSSLVQGILMLISDIDIHISRPIWYPGFILERTKKKFLLSMHSHSLVLPSSRVSFVVFVLQNFRLCDSPMVS